MQHMLLGFVLIALDTSFHPHGHPVGAVLQWTSIPVLQMWSLGLVGPITHPESYGLEMAGRGLTSGLLPSGPGCAEPLSWAGSAGGSCAGQQVRSQC